MDCSLPGSSVYGILQARILEWVAMKLSPPPGDLPDPGVKLMSLMSPALAGGFFTTKRHLGSPICWLETHKDENEIGFGWVLSWIEYRNFSALTLHQLIKFLGVLLQFASGVLAKFWQARFGVGDFWTRKVMLCKCKQLWHAIFVNQVISWICVEP